MINNIAISTSTMNNNTGWPKISVIIATYNSLSQSYLKECLDSVKKQKYSGEIEIIVSDGGSTDGTVSIASEYGARIIHNPKKTELGFNGGKNLAIKHATGDLIADVDADNILMEDDYFTQLVAPFIKDSRISMSFPAPYIPSKKEQTDLCRYFCSLESDLFGKYLNGIKQNSYIEITPADIIIPNGALLKKSIIDMIGGWDYDTEVGFRLVKTGFNKFAYVLTIHRLHLEMIHYIDVWRKYKRRIVNQISESKSGNKSRVQMEIDEKVANPSFFLKEELVNPLINMIEKKDFCYINAIPVFAIKLILILRYFKELTNRK